MSHLERNPGITYCFSHPREALVATMLKIGGSLPEGPGVSLGRKEDKESACQLSIPELTQGLVHRKK